MLPATELSAPVTSDAGAAMSLEFPRFWADSPLEQIVSIQASYFLLQWSGEAGEFTFGVFVFSVQEMEERIS